MCMIEHCHCPHERANKGFAHFGVLLNRYPDVLNMHSNAVETCNRRLRLFLQGELGRTREACCGRTVRECLATDWSNVSRCFCAAERVLPSGLVMDAGVERLCLIPASWRRPSWASPQSAWQIRSLAGSALPCGAVLASNTHVQYVLVQVRTML
jgi:hypothetical protein